jgi:hypothetical protein
MVRDPLDVLDTWPDQRCTKCVFSFGSLLDIDSTRKDVADTALSERSILAAIAIELGAPIAVSGWRR